MTAWTDSRDLVPGADPREIGADDDHDGFDVYQPCTYVPNDINAPSYSSPTIADPCLSQADWTRTSTRRAPELAPS
jgi:hypothetical protein